MQSEARDAYRNSTSVFFSGDTVSWTGEDLEALMSTMITKLEAGVAKAAEFGEDGVIPTYFIFNATSYVELGTKDADDQPYIAVTAFEPETVPLFLEGPARQLKTVTKMEDKIAIYENVRQTAFL